MERPKGHTLVYLSGSGWKPENALIADPEKHKNLGVLLTYWDLRGNKNTIQTRRLKTILGQLTE